MRQSVGLLSEPSTCADVAVRDLQTAIATLEPSGFADNAPATGARALSAAILVLVDGLACGALALFADRLAPTGESGHILINIVMLAGIVQIVLKAGLGLYPGYGLLFEARLRRLSLAWIFACAAISGAALVLVPASGAVLGDFWLAMGIVALTQTALASLARSALAAIGFWGVPVRVEGSAEQVSRLKTFVSANASLGYVPGGEDARDALLLWAGRGLPDPERLAELRRTSSGIVLVADLPKLPMSGVHPAQCRGELGLRLGGSKRSTSYTFAKRAFDLALCTSFLIVAAPVILVAALGVRLSDPGPVFYTQRREGLGGRPFDMLKLRTMYLDADRMLAELLERDPAARAEWETHFKLRRDPRVLPLVGAFLRGSSLDELPQLWNVMRGEMSLVGPRPFPIYHLSAMPPEFRARRSTVVPGLTGLWQISDRGTADLAAQEALDDFYINGRTLWGDISIILRTFAAVIGRKGAY